MKIGPYYYPERLSKDHLKSAKQLAKKAKKKNANPTLLDREYQLLLQYIFSVCHTVFLKQFQNRNVFMKLTNKEIESLTHLAVTAALIPCTCPSTFMRSSKGCMVDSAILASHIFNLLLWNNHFFDDYGSTNSEEFLFLCETVTFALYDIPSDKCIDMFCDREKLFNFYEKVEQYTIPDIVFDDVDAEPVPPFNRAETESIVTRALRNDYHCGEFCFLAEQNPAIPLLDISQEMALQRDVAAFVDFLLTFEGMCSPSPRRGCENPFPDGFICGTPFASMEHKKTSPSIVHNESQKLYNICVKNIEICEDIETVTPSCKQKLLEHIKRGLLTADESINKAMQKEEYDRERIALFLIINTAFNLLASGQFHIYRGWLDPHKCGASLLNVYEYCMDLAVRLKYITESDKKEHRQELQEAIEEVG